MSSYEQRQHTNAFLNNIHWVHCTFQSQKNLQELFKGAHRKKLKSAKETNR